MNDKIKDREALLEENTLLKVSKERFQLMYENAPLAYHSLDEQGHLVDVNPAWCDVMGYSKAEVLGRWFGEFLASGDKEKFKEVFSRFRADEKTNGIQLEVLRKDGTAMIAEIAGTISYDENGKFRQSHCIFHDITERKAAEKSLKESVERFRVLFEYAPDAYYITDLEGNFVDCNKMTEQIAGYKKEELIGKSYATANLLAKDKIAVAVADLQKNIRGEPAGPTQHTLYRKSGEKVEIEIRSFPIKIQGESLILTVARDITERKQLNQRFEIVAKVSSDLIYEWDVATDTLQWYGDMGRSLGYNYGEIPRTISAWISLIHPEDRDELKEAVSVHRQSIEPICEEYRVKRKDGTWAYWQDKATPILNASNQPVKWIGGCRDITLIKELEKNLKDKIRSLEVFQKAAVGRELKMVELKAKIKQLQASLQKKSS